MTWLIFFFGTGLAFFVGVTLQFLGISLSIRWRGHRARQAITIICVFGLVLVAASAVPLPYWLYALAGLCSVIWLLAERSESLNRIRVLFRWTAAAAWLTALVWETPYHFSPAVPALGQPRLVFLGDSLSAGAGESGVTFWPALLEREHSLEILDLSFPGAKVRSAVKQIKRHPLEQN